MEGKNNVTAAQHYVSEQQRPSDDVNRSIFTALSEYAVLLLLGYFAVSRNVYRHKV